MRISSTSKSRGSDANRRHLSPRESSLPTEAPPPLFACMASPAMLPAADDVAPEPVVAPLSTAVRSDVTINAGQAVQERLLDIHCMNMAEPDRLHTVAPSAASTVYTAGCIRLDHIGLDLRVPLQPGVWNQRIMMYTD